MNKLYNNRTKKGARVRVLGTNELGTVAEKHLIRKQGRADKSLLQGRARQGPRAGRLVLRRKAVRHVGHRHCHLR